MIPERHGRSWWPWLVAAVTVTTLLGLVAVTFEPLGRKDGLQIAANRAQLTGGLLIAAAIPAMAVLIWAHRLSLQARTVTVPTTDALEHAKEVLARVVAWQWKREAELRLLDDPDPIPVRWKLTDQLGLMDHPGNIEPTPASGLLHPMQWWASSADIAALAGRFRQLSRRRLAILGGAGMGKTTLATQLLLYLIKTRVPAEPVSLFHPRVTS